MELKYENRLVLFLDILGFKNLINISCKNTNVLNNIYQAVYEIQNYENKSGKISSREVTTFSDSIVISYPIHNSMFMRVFQEIRDLVLILLKYGFVCRGGVGIGELYHKDSVVFGPAMVKAYELESKYAKVPRVIISKADIDKYNFTGLEWDLKLDDDGFAYFDIFKFYYSESGELMYISQFIKEKLEEVIRKYIDSPDEGIKFKYNWLLKKMIDGLEQKICFVPVQKNGKE
ncbi:hypothetical protein [Ruminiclostridium cellulolyticum]|uniref:Guanylate cyclase domain-containing protein n=1 Tax=Ruminiclostridium cellulolyticum (strain ATCC 35319 / DSM 5812 / JCM 6584 / H10) TaxID=394503 RepID=B8I0C1_RUMCH|nr:hypothetical protein [Ruminiclostridium cellulolyticum]ACL77447.1 hypothetical protein Ccel_3156 [Ruminiclostridium cellulolyticum H10]